MNFKVIGGTPQHGVKSLCETCRFAHVSKGFNENQIMVRCGASRYEDSSGYLSYSPGQIAVRFLVAECTGYSDKRIPTVPELSKKALIIDPERVRVQGFAPKKD